MRGKRRTGKGKEGDTKGKEERKGRRGEGRRI